MGNPEILVAASGLAVLGIVLYVLRRRMSGRIARLLNEAGDIATRGRFDARVTVSGDDDLALLGATVNSIIEEARHRGHRPPVTTMAPGTALLDSVSLAMVIHRDTILYANPKAAALRGIRQMDLVGQPPGVLFHDADRNRVEEIHRLRRAGEKSEERYEAKMLRRDGSGAWVEVADTLVEFDGEPAILSTAFEISQRKREEDRVRRDRDRAHLTVASIGDGIITIDAEGLIRSANPAATAMLAVSEAEALGNKLDSLVTLVDETDRKPLHDPVARCLKEHRQVNLGRTALLLAADGQEYSVELAVSPLKDERLGVLGCVAVLHDVTEMRGLARQMSYQASHDALTGLLNRREFEGRLEDALRSVPKSGSGHVVCYLDLDRFKAVNDTCGHMAGDQMLRQIASLIKEKVRDSDSVARLGGDEFGLLLVGCPLPKARQIADDVCTAVEDFRFVWREKIFNVSVSIGLVEIGLESGTVEDALSAADSACYVAKQRGRSHVHVYSAKDEATARHRGEIMWLQRLQHALKEDAFYLFSQPIVATSGHDRGGPACEILLRMKDPQGADIKPGEFVEAAQRYHLMPSIDRWVIRATLTAIGAGSVKIPADRRCTINLSGQTLGDPQFLEYVVECLDDTGVSPTQVCFEVTESAVITNMSHAKRFIAVLHGLGCHFALDDFGSGMGSFANLRNLAMDYIKIDGSFTRNVGEDAVNQAMIAAMVKLARSLKIRVVAEQIENQAALDAVRRMGVDYVQGYIIGKPMPLPVRPSS